MDAIDLADASARLGELVERAEAGPTIEILREGKPVARLTAAPAPRKPIDAERLAALTAAMPLQAEGAGDFIRRMRDEDRY